MASPSLRIHTPAPRETLKAALDAVEKKYDRGYLETDPLKYVHRYADPRDREVVGLISAAFAYGSVVLIFRAVERILAEMGPHPRAFLDSFDPVRDRAKFRGFRHRFHDGRDVALFLSLVAQAVREHGTLGALFEAGYSEADADVGPALSHFVATILAGDPRPFFPSGKLPQPHGVRFLLSSPQDGSACKRMLLYLRWMLRPDDGVDVGTWAGRVPPSKLLLPLDTHTFRICRYLGFTARNANDWRAAEEATAVLKSLDPADPVRYDFALCRLGILDLCPAKRDEKKCVPCELYTVCRL
jgi:uncharacterized protein (TIGR02757 family)